MIGSFCLVRRCTTILPASCKRIQFYLHISSIYVFRDFFPFFSFSDAHSHKRNENIFLSAVGTVPLFSSRGKNKIIDKCEKQNNLLMDSTEYCCSVRFAWSDATKGSRKHQVNRYAGVSRIFTGSRCNAIDHR